MWFLQAQMDCISIIDSIKFFRYGPKSKTLIQKPTTLLFDFDGTVADTLPHILHIANRFADVYGYNKVLESEITAYREKKARQAIRDLNVPLLLIPRIATRVRKELSKEIHLIQPVLGIREVLSQLKTQYTLGIVTSNSSENVQRFLQTHQMEWFDVIHAKSSIFGKSRILKCILKEQQLRTPEVMYVGDEVRDVEAASKTGIRMVAVSWGVNTRNTLTDANPTFLIDTPDELLQLLE